MEKEGNCQSHIYTYLCLTLSFMSNHFHSQENHWSLVLAVCALQQRNWGETAGERQSLKTGDTSVLGTLVGTCSVPLGWGRRQGVELGSTRWWLGHAAGLAQRCLLPVPILGGKEQQECSGRAPGAHSQDWPWQWGGHPSTAFCLLQWWNLLTEKFD